MAVDKSIDVQKYEQCDVLFFIYVMEAQSKYEHGKITKKDVEQNINLGKKNRHIRMAVYCLNKIEIRFQTQKVVHLGQAAVAVL